MVLVYDGGSDGIVVNILGGGMRGFNLKTVYEANSEIPKMLASEKYTASLLCNWLCRKRAYLTYSCNHP